MSKATIDSVHPVLPSQDVARSIEFYTQKLGFELVFQDSPDRPRYAGLRRDGVEIHIQWHDASEWHAVERPMLRFVVPRVEALFAEWAAQEVYHERTALRDTAWRTTEFAFYDPDKNGLTFYRDRAPAF